MTTKTFEELVSSVRKENFTPHPPLLALDPGETCGWAFFKHYNLEDCGEVKIETYPDSRIYADYLWHIFEKYSPQVAVIEGYRVFPHKTQHHSWNALYTPKLVGYIEAICQRVMMSYHIQMASSKQFCTNEKLLQWGMYQKGNPHANDAIRHACYYLLFHKRR